MNEATGPGSHQADPHKRARLRWRGRRGLLENDIIITRFLDRYETTLSDEDVGALTQLFEMVDTDLIDLILGRQELKGEMDTVPMRRIVDLLRIV